MSSDPIHKLSLVLKTPYQVQKYIRAFPYNKGNTLYSAEITAIKKTAHCFEASLFAAAVLERHGYPPLVMSLESRDDLDHVVYIFRERGKWGAIGQSREEGLRGRKPVFSSLEALALSYYEPYVDDTGEVWAYQIAHLDDTETDWRFSRRNVWKAEKYLIDLQHVTIRQSERRYKRLKELYLQRGPMPRLPFWW